MRLTNHRTILIVISIIIICFTNNEQFGQIKNQSVLTDSELEEIHNKAIVVDAHAHPWVLYDNNDDNKEMLRTLRKGGVDVIGHYFVYRPIENSSLLDTVRKDITHLKRQIVDDELNVKIVSDTKSLKEIVRENNTALLLGLEYFYGVFQDDVNRIDSLYETGIRSITLVDAENDMLSIRNNKEESGTELNDFGKEVIDRMNQKGMLIDISHLDDGMQKAVIEYSSAPVMATHSPVRAIHDIQRNIPDEVLLNLAKKNGAIMITFSSRFLAGLEDERADIDKLLDHIMHAIEVVGVDKVGIGSDLFHASGSSSPKGLEDASGFPNITKQLYERGLNKEEIEKVLGLNYLRVLKEVEEYASK